MSVMVEIDYDYYNGRPVRVTEERAAFLAALQARIAAGVMDLAEAKAIIIAANRSWTP